MALLVNELIDRVRREFEKGELEWEVGRLDEKDYHYLESECNKESEFDLTNKRKKMFIDLINGHAKLGMAKCEFGTIYAVFESDEQNMQMPWQLWGRIFRIFSETEHKPFKVFFLANTKLRKFPSHNEPISPENINGGYTYRCDPETVFIYRAEDATRVLIHELLHACCLDRMSEGIDMIEAETEAWAELIYIAVLSQGKKFIFNSLLQRQSEWMRKQNQIVRKHISHPKSRQFPWRYTIGKQEIWEKWGILKMEDAKPSIHISKSLRLTYPPDKVLKERFKVTLDSTIL
jgi:hypothetical protein